jgi:transposase
MITEIGDVKRFSHPRQRVSWMGLDIREYSSGGKQRRFGITKNGNRYLGTAFIEANQRGYRSARLSQAIKARRAHAAPELIAIADRCLRRLNSKGHRLLRAGKPPNKIKVAGAREMEALFGNRCTRRRHRKQGFLKDIGGGVQSEYLYLLDFKSLI